MTIESPAALADLNDPDVFVAGVPYETFAHWRRTDPVHLTKHPEGHSYWSVTTYDEVVLASRDGALFSNERGGVFMFEMEEEMLAQQNMLMLMMDPPRHTRYRLLVSRAFTPRNIRALEEYIDRTATEIVDNVIERGECDFVTDVAAELPLQVIAEMMGVPQQDRKLIFDWSNRMIGSEDPEFAQEEGDAEHAMTELFAYSHALVDKRRANPREDIITALTQAEIEGDRLSELEIDLFFLLLAVAGNETTRNLTANGMHALFQHPDQLAKLQGDLSLIDSATEEMLRCCAPVMYFRRTATADTVLGGKEINAGDAVVLWYIAANRDEQHFITPDEFLVDRTPNEHIAFGGRGPHFCLGANLARSEIKKLFVEVLSRMDNLQLAGDVSRLRSNFINGIKHMPVTFDPGPKSTA
ncbi:MAG: cytochrome P450 [Acidimicrobiia bacterium]